MDPTGSQMNEPDDAIMESSFDNAAELFTSQEDPVHHETFLQYQAEQDRMEMHSQFAAMNNPRFIPLTSRSAMADNTEVLDDDWLVDDIDDIQDLCLAEDTPMSDAPPAEEANSPMPRDDKPPMIVSSDPNYIPHQPEKPPMVISSDWWKQNIPDIIDVPKPLAMAVERDGNLIKRGPPSGSGEVDGGRGAQIEKEDFEALFNPEAVDMFNPPVSFDWPNPERNTQHLPFPWGQNSFPSQPQPARVPELGGHGEIFMGYTHPNEWVHDRIGMASKLFPQSDPDVNKMWEDDMRRRATSEPTIDPSKLMNDMSHCDMGAQTRTNGLPLRTPSSQHSSTFSSPDFFATWGAWLEGDEHQQPNPAQQPAATVFEVSISRPLGTKTRVPRASNTDSESGSSSEDEEEPTIPMGGDDGDDMDWNPASMRNTRKKAPARGRRAATATASAAARGPSTSATPTPSTVAQPPAGRQPSTGAQASVPASRKKAAPKKQAPKKGQNKATAATQRQSQGNDLGPASSQTAAHRDDLGPAPSQNAVPRNNTTAAAPQAAKQPPKKRGPPKKKSPTDSTSAPSGTSASGTNTSGTSISASDKKKSPPTLWNKKYPGGIDQLFRKERGPFVKRPQQAPSASIPPDAQPSAPGTLAQAPAGGPVGPGAANLAVFTTNAPAPAPGHNPGPSGSQRGQPRMSSAGQQTGQHFRPPMTTDEHRRQVPEFAAAVAAVRQLSPPPALHFPGARPHHGTSQQDGQVMNHNYQQGGQGMNFSHQQAGQGMHFNHPQQAGQAMQFNHQQGVQMMPHNPSQQGGQMMPYNPSQQGAQTMHHLSPQGFVNQQSSSPSTSQTMHSGLSPSPMPRQRNFSPNPARFRAPLPEGLETELHRAWEPLPEGFRQPATVSNTDTYRQQSDNDFTAWEIRNHDAVQRNDADLAVNRRLFQDEQQGHPIAAASQSVHPGQAWLDDFVRHNNQELAETLVDLGSSFQEQQANVDLALSAWLPPSSRANLQAQMLPPPVPANHTRASIAAVDVDEEAVQAVPAKKKRNTKPTAKSKAAEKARQDALVIHNTRPPATHPYIPQESYAQPVMPPFMPLSPRTRFNRAQTPATSLPEPAKPPKKQPAKRQSSKKRTSSAANLDDDKPKSKRAPPTKKKDAAPATGEESTVGDDKPKPKRAQPRKKKDAAAPAAAEESTVGGSSQTVFANETSPMGSLLPSAGGRRPTAAASRRARGVTPTPAPATAPSGAVSSRLRHDPVWGGFLDRSGVQGEEEEEVEEEIVVMGEEEDMEE